MLGEYLGTVKKVFFRGEKWFQVVFVHVYIEDGLQQVGTVYAS